MIESHSHLNMKSRVAKPDSMFSAIRDAKLVVKRAYRKISMTRTKLSNSTWLLLGGTAVMLVLCTSFLALPDVEGYRSGSSFRRRLSHSDEMSTQQQLNEMTLKCTKLKAQRDTMKKAMEKDGEEDFRVRMVAAAAGAIQGTAAGLFALHIKDPQHGIISEREKQLEALLRSQGIDIPRPSQLKKVADETAGNTDQLGTGAESEGTSDAVEVYIVEWFLVSIVIFSALQCLCCALSAFYKHVHLNKGAYDDEAKINAF